MKAAVYRRSGTNGKCEAMKGQVVEIQIQLLFLPIPKLYTALQRSQVARKSEKSAVSHRTHYHCLTPLRTRYNLNISC
ncbi:hypothetical protein VNO80_09037 [Phaseolus coccineus]|uniref:Uncharacterized protein n=1 Tax=Phaseolus coccineus TaxID=3886 RepID=A0AAN9N790_PHACN